MYNTTWDWERPGKGCAWNSTQGISAEQGRAQHQSAGQGKAAKVMLACQSSQGNSPAKIEKVLESKWSLVSFYLCWGVCEASYLC